MYHPCTNEFIIVRKREARETVQQLKVHTALTGDLSLIPGPSVKGFTTVFNSSSRASSTSLWPLRVPVLINTRPLRLIHIIKNQIF